MRRDESGQILLMTALMLPVLLGFAALAVDAGFALDLHKRLQTAADSAALAGAFAVDYETGIGQAGLEAIVRADAAQNGLQHGAASVTVTVVRAPGKAEGFDEDYSDDPTAVGVAITQPGGMFFVRALSAAFASLTIKAKAVASKSADTRTSAVIFGKDSFGADVIGLDTRNGASVRVAGDVHVNSAAVHAAFASEGGANVQSSNGRVYVTGGYAGSIAPVTAGVPPVPDPLRNLPVPSPPIAPGACSGSVCSPGRYDNGLHPADQTLQPGLYYVRKGAATAAVTFRGQVGGSGVTIYIEEDTWHVSGTATVHLSAPTDGPYAGVLIFQRRDNPADAEVDHSLIDFTGAVYMKSGAVRFRSGGGTSTTAPYCIFVVNQLQLRGGTATLNAAFASLSGGSPLKRISLAE